VGVGSFMRFGWKKKELRAIERGNVAEEWGRGMPNNCLYNTPFI